MLKKEQSPNKSKFNFNLWLTEIFLYNHRLTILSFIGLVLLGTFTIVQMKPSGFPNPEIKFAFIQTVYPGASSEIVNRDITIPLENIVKDIEGVESYTSNSSNSFSGISISIDQNADTDNVKNKISTAIQSVDLPEDSQKPTLLNLDIGGPDFIYSVTGENSEKIYDISEKLKEDLKEFPEISKFEAEISLEKRLVIKLNTDELAKNGITIDNIVSKLKNTGESLPVISDISIDDKSQSIVTSLKSTSLDDIKNLSFISPIPTPVPTKIILKDIASFDTSYETEDNLNTYSGIRQNEESILNKSQVFSIKAVKGSDLAKLDQKIKDKISSYEEVDLITYEDQDKSFDKDKVQIIENYSVNASNQEQVSEVVNGLIGGPLDTNNPFLSNLGWILGGIQLVFLVMVAFVSWRAALISAISIPLSLSFSTIYLYFTGQSLNTLVLFSLVLVIGLVVDPTLVILEAIQRKIDTGLRGKEASLEAVKDVGMGLFLATLTNIIVFVPFGIISGILGQIFKYIPLTIIPAVIGSYIVPIVFLAWLGGIFLKSNKNTTSSEEENLWGVGKWLINLNQKILAGNKIIPIIIIISGLIIPVGISAYYFGTRQIISVSFSSGENSNEAFVSGVFINSLTSEDKKDTLEDILKMIQGNKGVKDVYSIETGKNSFQYYINFVSTDKREGYSSKAIIADFRKELEKFDDKLFDYTTDIITQGPPTSDYQVALSIKNNDLDIIKKSNVEIGKTLETACLLDDKIIFDQDCKGGKKLVQKVDDGFTGKDNQILDFKFDRNTLEEKSLLLGQNIPATALVNNTIKQNFILNNNQKVTSIDIEGKDTPIYLESNNSSPKNIDELNQINITNLQGQNFKISDIGSIEKTSQKFNIQRVKGQTIGVIKAKLDNEYNNDQAIASRISNALIEKYQADDGKLLADLDLNKESLETYSEGDTAGFLKSFGELSIALLLAIFSTYIVLALFFNSFTQPLVILYTIPLTFIGIMPALAHLSNGQFGFLEIIGMIILVGIVENGAIFLIDSANQRIAEGEDAVRAITVSSGIRLKPVLMTKFTAIASLAPLAWLSEIYRPISLVIMFGLLSSGFISLITTPILFTFFRWSSKNFHDLNWFLKVLFYPLMPFFWIYWAYKKK